VTCPKFCFIERGWLDKILFLLGGQNRGWVEKRVLDGRHFPALDDFGQLARSDWVILPI
jgi:hypothetical protein